MGQKYNVNPDTGQLSLTGTGISEKIIFNDGTDESSIIVGGTDPSALAVDADTGSLYINTLLGQIYIKQDDGSSTNWIEIGSNTSTLRKVFKQGSESENPSTNTIFSSTVPFQLGGNNLIVIVNGKLLSLEANHYSIDSTTQITLSSGLDDSDWILMLVGLSMASSTVILDDLSDVIITAPSTNQRLQYNGSYWVNATVSSIAPVLEVGQIIYAAGILSDSRLLPCDGSIYLQSSYTDLYSAIGHRYATQEINKYSGSSGSNTYSFGSATDSVLVATNNNNEIRYTSDGQTWSVSDATSVAWKDIANDGTTFCCVGYSTSSAITSTNGSNWTVHATLPSSDTWYLITTFDDRFFTATYDTTNSAYSTDSGATWSSGPTIPINLLAEIASDNIDTAVITAYGASQVAYTTNKGVSWNTANMPKTSNWRNVTYNPASDLFIAVSDENVDYVVCAYADDLENWFCVPTPHNLLKYQISCKNDGTSIILPYTNNISTGLISRDGLYWQKFGGNVDSVSARDGCWIGELFIALPDPSSNVVTVGPSYNTSTHFQVPTTQILNSATNAYIVASTT